MSVIQNIQVLRAFAAINVLIFHIIGTASGYAASTVFIQTLQGWGENGVDLFFVISGFVMLHTQMKRRQAPMHFLKLRILRIVPLYWLLTAFVVIVCTISPNVFRGLSISLSHVFSSLFFTSQFFNNSFPILCVGWTLEWEMLFYLVFTLALRIQSWERFFLCVASMLVAIALITKYWIVLEFLMGMSVAYSLYHWRLSQGAGLWIFLMGFVLLLLSLVPSIAAQEWERALIWGIPSFLIVLGAVYARQSTSSLLSYLGDASYSIYLTQVFSIAAFYKLSSRLGIALHGDLLALLCLLFSLALACGIYSFIEKPLTVYLRRRVQGVAPTKTAV